MVYPRIQRWIPAGASWHYGRPYKPPLPNIFSFLLKKKVANIAEEAQTIVRRTGGATGTILALGAYDVDPRLLMFVVQVAKDADREHEGNWAFRFS